MHLCAAYAAVSCAEFVLAQAAHTSARSQVGSSWDGVIRLLVPTHKRRSDGDVSRVPFVDNELSKSFVDDVLRVLEIDPHWQGIMTTSSTSKLAMV